MYPKLAILDMVGTTIDDNGIVLETLVDVMKLELNINITLTDAINVMGIPKNIAFETLCSIYGIEISHDLINQLISLFNQKIITAFQMENNVKLLPFVGELFASMRKHGTKIYLNTGFERSIADVIVNSLGLMTIVDGYVCANDVTKGRPNADMILLAMKKENIQYGHHVMKIGDTTSDLYEGFSAGCAWNIAVLTGAQNYEQLRTAPFTQILANLQPVVNFFNSGRSF